MFDTEFAEAASRTAAAPALFCGEINNNYHLSPVMIRLDIHVTFSYPIIFRSTPTFYRTHKKFVFENDGPDEAKSYCVRWWPCFHGR
jgi:hypothetical protein